MYSKYYINGREVDANEYCCSCVDGVHEQYSEGKVYSHVYHNREHLGNIEEVEANKLSFLVRFGMSFEQWCKKNGYKTEEESNG